MKWAGFLGVMISFVATSSFSEGGFPEYLVVTPKLDLGEFADSKGNGVEVYHVEFAKKGDDHPWYFLYYEGRAVDNSLGEILILDDNEKRGSRVRSIEIGKKIGEWEIEGWTDFDVEFGVNLAERLELGRSNFYELAAFFSLRWDNVPWKDYLLTSFALGEGVSYSQRINESEEEDFGKDAKKLLNFLVTEMTLGLPALPDLTFVYRIHHRSGAYGLYGVSGGSNAPSWGLKYIFKNF